MFSTSKKALISLAIAFGSTAGIAQQPESGIRAIMPSGVSNHAASTPELSPDIEIDDSKLSNPELFTTLNDTAAPALERYAAIRALGIRALTNAHLQAQVIEHYLPLLTKDTDPALRSQIMYWTGRIAEKSPPAMAEKIFNTVIKLIKTEQDDDVRAGAASLTGAIAEQHKSMVQPALMTLVPLVVGDDRDPSSVVRHKTLRALAWLGMRYPGVAEIAYIALIDGAQNDTDDHARWQCIRSLGWIGEEYPKHAAGALTQLFKNLDTDKDPEIRAQAITSIGAIARKNVHLAQLARDFLRSIGNKGEETDEIRELAIYESDTIVVNGPNRRPQTIGLVTPQ